MPTARSKSNSKRKLTQNRARRKNGPDVIDQAAAGGMEIYNGIWSVPGAVLDKTISTALQAKDAVKRKVFGNPSREENEAMRYELLAGAATSRNAQELARIHKWATSRGDSELAKVAEARARNLGLDIKGSYPRGWNPKVTDRAVRAHRARRNPENLAGEGFKRFHGEPSSETIVIEEEVHYHKDLATIGVLTSCVIETPTGLTATITFDSNDGKQVPWLCMSEDGVQMFIEGGDQYIDLKTLKLNGDSWNKERMVLGQFAPPRCRVCDEVIPKIGEDLANRNCRRCGHRFVTFEEAEKTGKKEDRTWNIGYTGQKDFDNFEDILYLHDLGAPSDGEHNRKEPPTLEYEPINKKLFITGGQYKIDLPVFQTSPGIEN